jgi:hypothetical protein
MVCPHYLIVNGPFVDAYDLQFLLGGDWESKNEKIEQSCGVTKTEGETADGCGCHPTFLFFQLH